MAIGVMAVVMIVSGLRRMWRRDRFSRTAVSWKTYVVIRGSLLVEAVVADDREEHVFDGSAASRRTRPWSAGAAA